MEPTLVVVGLNHRTAAVEVRERFWMAGCRQAEVLSILAQAEGIEEVIVFSTSNRTEFILWGDATLAVNSILRLLTAEYDLKLQEWNSFYRLLDEQALTHAFRVSCGLDAMYIGEGHIARQFAIAWQQARNAGCTGRHLDSLLRQALAVRRRVRKETEFVSHLVSAPHAAIQLAEQIFGSTGVALAGKNVVLFGAGQMAESAARELVRRGSQSICLVNHNDSSAQELAGKLSLRNPAIRAGAFEERWKHLASADLVICATSAPGFVFTANDMKRVAMERNEALRNESARNQNANARAGKLLLIDLALPRNIDPAVRVFEGVLVYDLEDIERAIEPRGESRSRNVDAGDAPRVLYRTARRLGEDEAERIVQAEVREFRKQLLLGGAPPELTALRTRLDEICRQELESFRLEQGPFPKDQDRLLAAVGTRITQKIAGSLARDLISSAHPRAAKRASISA